MKKFTVLLIVFIVTFVSFSTIASTQKATDTELPEYVYKPVKYDEAKKSYLEGIVEKLYHFTGSSKDKQTMISLCYYEDKGNFYLIPGRVQLLKKAIDNGIYVTESTWAVSQKRPRAISAKGANPIAIFLAIDELLKSNDMDNYEKDYSEEEIVPEYRFANLCNYDESLLPISTLIEVLKNNSPIAKDIIEKVEKDFPNLKTMYLWHTDDVFFKRS